MRRAIQREEASRNLCFEKSLKRNDNPEKRYVDNIYANNFQDEKASEYIYKATCKACRIARIDRAAFIDVRTFFRTAFFHVAKQ